MAIRPKIGLALGSGGARGWCHIGVLRALAEIGVIPDMVAGTSIGALVGAAWAGGKLGELEAWVRALTARRFVTLMDVSLGSGGLVEARKIEALLEQLELSERIETLERPFCAVATDMETGREIWLKRGPTYRAVRASAGIPGVMSPIHYQGHWLLDGGLTNPVPVSALRVMGAEILIAVNPSGKAHGKIWSPPEQKPGAGSWLSAVLPFGIPAPDTSAPELVAPNYFDVLTAALDVMEDTIRRARLAGEPPHITLNSAFDEFGVLELYRGAEAIEEGRRMVMAQEAQIREVCGV
jgi:NTE family protein